MCFSTASRQLMASFSLFPPRARCSFSSDNISLAPLYNLFGRPRPSPKVACHPRPLLCHGYMRRASGRLPRSSATLGVLTRPVRIWVLQACHPSFWMVSRRHMTSPAALSSWGIERRRRQALKARFCRWWRDYRLGPGEYLQRRSVFPRFPAADGIRHKSQSV